jgi:hypothetical protein
VQDATGTFRRCVLRRCRWEVCFCGCWCLFVCLFVWLGCVLFDMVWLGGQQLAPPLSPTPYPLLTKPNTLTRTHTPTHPRPQMRDDVPAILPPPPRQTALLYPSSEPLPDPTAGEGEEEESKEKEEEEEEEASLQIPPSLKAEGEGEGEREGRSVAVLSPEGEGERKGKRRRMRVVEMVGAWERAAVVGVQVSGKEGG